MSTELAYKRKLIKRQAQAEAAMKRVYHRYIENVAKHARNPKARISNAFQIRNNEFLGAILTGDYYADFRKDLYAINKNYVTGAWEMAGEKNTEVFGAYLNILKEHTGKPDYSFDINRKQLTAFIQGEGTSKLSTKVWKPARQFKEEMMVHMGVGIANGDSSATIARRTKQYLQNPDALYRRVATIDSEGRKVYRWSKRALKYKPGQGVYRSAYKNSMRVMRTSTNQAYFSSDLNQWRRQKFVIGYEVVLSPAHPILDICDDLVGKYPKTFVFSGWHPHCLCTMLPILMKPEQFKSYLKGNQVKVPRYDLPYSFTSFLARNREKIIDNKFNAWFIDDNLVKSHGHFKFNDKRVRLPKRPKVNIAHESVYER